LSCTGESVIIIHGQKNARTNPTGFLSTTAGAAKSIAPFAVPFSKPLPEFRDSGFTDAQSRQTNAARFTLLVKSYWLRGMQI
jgi:hypothetical protein